MPRESSRPPVQTVPEGAVLPDAPASAEVEKAGWRARLGRILPFVRGFVRTLRGIGIVSAVSAALIVGVLYAQQWVALGVAGAILLFLILLIPSGAAFLAAWTLKGLLDLPIDLKASAKATAGHLKQTATEKGERSVGLLRSIWSLRKLVLDSRGALASAAGLVRIARLPAMLGLLAAVALNGLVIGAAALVSVLAWIGGA